MAGYWPSYFFARFVPYDSTNKGAFFIFLTVVLSENRKVANSHKGL